MLAFILRKTLRALLTMFLVVTFTFLILRISGDPTEVMFPDDVPQEVKDAYRTAWGLDRPLPEQFAKYLISVGHGDLGYSFRDSRPALDVVTERIPATLRLGLCSFALSICLGIPLGLCAAFRRNTFLDRLATSVSVMGYSMPNFFLGILLILLFSLKLRLLPSSGSATPEHLIMPVITLGTATAGIVARFTRTAVLDVLGQPFVMAAKAKGLSVSRLIFGHVLPNAAIPVITILGLQLGSVIGGALVTETVFAWPGIGRLLVQSVNYRDLAVVQTIVLIIAASMIICNLLVDMAYGWLDPRIRSERAGN
ncbi:ABC transporter permease [uncultured Mailhella sp.]|uniref:ABC transporter permease n=1 Tax=uncultured Mailhella sp. TaxID=1981031 RepID=UPI0025CF9968|nr:ABC transporter permease [uncultured Mailhella sp.]